MSQTDPSIDSRNMGKNHNVLLWPAEYYLDNVRVNSQILADTTLYKACTYKVVNGDSTVIFDCFTTSGGYINCGNFHGLMLEEALLLEQDLSLYSQTSGAESYFNSTGKILKSYEQYEYDQFEYYFGFPHNGSQKTMLTIFHKNIAGGADKTIFNTTPAFISGWNNSVSAFTPIGVYGVTILYDRHWYKNRMITMWGWGMQRVTLNGALSYLDNRTGSVICHNL